MASQNARMRQLIGTTAEWAANDLVIGNGEIAVERVSASQIKIKIGDGTSPFSALPYLSTPPSASVSGGLAFKGAIDVTAAAPSTRAAGDYYAASKAGAIDASWTGITGNIRTGDIVLWDGSAWHTIAQEADLSAYLPLAGGTMTGPVTLPAQTGTGAAVPTALQAVSQGYIKQYVSERIVSVKDFGAVGDGVTDDTAAFNAALTAQSGKTIFIPDPSVGYLLTAKLTIPTDTKLLGQNKRTTKLLHGYNGDFCDLGGGASLENIYIEGQGATYTGKGVLYTGSNGAQSVINCRVINFDSACFDFAVGAGSASSHLNIETYRTSAGTGTGRYAISISATQQLSAVPRKFSMIETGGSCAFDFGGGNNVYISDSFLGDLNYTADSRAVIITTTRIANQAALTLRGFNSGIVGCDVAPQLTLDAGSDSWSIGPNSYNSLPIIDNSGSARNIIQTGLQNYTPVLGSGGTPPSLGNGTLTGTFAKCGPMTVVNVNLTLGATTTLGTGGLSFTLPATIATNLVAAGGNVICDRAGTLYTGVCQVASGASVFTLLRDTSGSITFNSPATWAAGDTIRASLWCMN